MTTSPAQAETDRLEQSADAFAAAGRFDQAVEYLRSAMRLNPELHHVHRRIWALHQQSGRLPEVAERFRAALASLYRNNAPETLSAERMKIEHTTLCAVDCIYPDLTIAAMQRCMAHCSFDAAKLLTSEKIEASGIETIAIEPIRSSKAYSTFMLKELLEHIDTDHVLTVQWDGFICNAQSWSNTFLLYDFIGARWPDEILADARAFNVGNGGFSLRSRTLLEALQDPKIVDLHPEDARLSRQYRPYLEERYGIAFAGPQEADRFSYEHCFSETPSFGFHGLINLSRHLPWTELRSFEFLD